MNKLLRPSPIHSASLTGAALLAAALLTAGGCAPRTGDRTVTWRSDGVPHHEHADARHDWWTYQFVYYPRAEVYFEPFSQEWWWFEDGRWRSGLELPAGRTTFRQTPTVVFFQTPWPFVQHGNAVAMHNPTGVPHQEGSTDFAFTPAAFAALNGEDPFTYERFAAPMSTPSSSEQVAGASEE